MAEVAQAYVSLMFSARGAQDQITKEIGGAGRSSGARAAKEFHGSFLPGIKSLGAAVGGVFAAEKVAGFFKDAVSEARESQKVGAITANVIKTTGGAANVSAKQVGNLATAISNKTGIDDEAVQSASNLLLTFTNVRNEAGKGNKVFNQATQAATDMAAAMGKPPKAAAIQLGKALNDPVKGITALSKAGVSFTAKQKKIIAGDVKHGKTLKAQKIILHEVKKEFGGTAAASSTAGEKAATAFANFKEQIGTALLPVIDKVETALTNKVIPAVSNFVSGLQNGTGVGGKIASVFKTVGGFVGGKLASGFKVVSGAVHTFFDQLHNGTGLGGQVADVFKTVADAVQKFIGQMKDGTGPGGQLADVLKKVATAVKDFGPKLQAVLGFLANNKATVAAFAGTILTIVAAFRIWAAVTRTLAAVQAVLDAVLAANPIMLVVIAIAALVAGLVYAYRHSKTFASIVNGAFHVVQTVVGAVVGFVKDHLLLVVGVLGGPFALALVLLVKHFGAAKKGVEVAIHAIGAVGRWLWNNVFAPVFRFILGGIGKLMSGFGKMLHALGHVPGFGWAKKAGDVMEAAGRKAQGFADHIKNIPTHHDVGVTVNYSVKGMALVYAAQAAAKHAEITPRAKGGPVLKGGMYLVGENGPELFSPRGNGHIIPNTSRSYRGVQPPGATAGPAAGRTVALMVGDRTFNAYLTEVADSRIKARRNLNATLGRQR